MRAAGRPFLLPAIPPSRPSLQRNAIRMLTWLSASAVFWIAGGIAEEQSRVVLWAVALGIEYLSPAARFWLPTYVALSIGDWTIEGGQMVESRAGVITVGFRESIAFTGVTFGDLNWASATVSAVV